MIVPLFVGREKSIRALEEVIGTDRQILLVTQINASDDDPAAVGDLRSRHRRQRVAAAETARWHRQGAGRRPRARPHRRLHRAARISTKPSASARRAEEDPVETRGDVALGRLRVRKLRQAQQEDFARSGQRGQPDRRLFQARRHGRLASVDQARPTSRKCSKPSPSRAGSKRRSASWKARSRSCRSKSASARASSARWRRPSANTISMSR